MNQQQADELFKAIEDLPNTGVKEVFESFVEYTKAICKALGQPIPEKTPATPPLILGSLWEDRLYKGHVYRLQLGWVGSVMRYKLKFMSNEPDTFFQNADGGVYKVSEDEMRSELKNRFVPYIEPVEKVPFEVGSIYEQRLGDMLVRCVLVCTCGDLETFNLHSLSSGLSYTKSYTRKKMEEFLQDWKYLGRAIAFSLPAG